MDYESILQRVAQDVAPLVGKGEVARYIPPLAMVDPRQFGMALRTVDGEVYSVGVAGKRFSIQSVSKVFSLAQALTLLGDDVWQRLGREPSGAPFNSLIQLEVEHGLPRNPFINPGALVVVDILASHFAYPETAVFQFIRRLATLEGIDIDLKLARAEQDAAHRNIAMAHFIKSFGNLHNDVDLVVRSYCNQCSILMSCIELVQAVAFLANGGIAPHDGSRIVSAAHARRINALLAMCGTYDGAGDFAYRVGLPAKSGVSGCILAVVPGRATVAVWSPGLDEAGNSLAGVAALERLAEVTGWSIF